MFDTFFMMILGHLGILLLRYISCIVFAIYDDGLTLSATIDLVIGNKSQEKHDINSICAVVLPEIKTNDI